MASKGIRASGSQTRNSRTSWAQNAWSVGCAVLTILASQLANAQAAAPAKVEISAGDTSWVLISSALVLLMTPGLALFYAGMVRSKNVVSTLLKSFASLGVVGLIWALVGYSLAFSKTHSGLIGGLEYIFLRGVGQDANPDYAATIPQLAFMIFQCMFAVITPALITGAIVERIRFKAWMLIMVLWSLLVYVPVAHWVWGVGGWIRERGALDFAGGMVVHMTAGYSALVMAMMVGRRKDESHSAVPHDIGMVVIGTALLFFGWFGFNAGSALTAGGLAAQAFATTFFAGAAAMVSWMAADWIRIGKPSAMGSCIGAVAGLVAITPAAGFVELPSAIVIGLIAGVGCNLAVAFIKNRFALDDSLDVFGCHGVGGTLGSILTAIFAAKSVNSAGADGVIHGNWSLLTTHLVTGLVVVVYSMLVTGGIVMVVRLFTPVRVDEKAEDEGLDFSQHGERIGSTILHSLTGGAAPKSGAR
jgi:Amt family ammonium transporter